MTQVIFHPSASLEFEETSDYYNTERQGLGMEFQEEVQHVLALLSSFPRLGQQVHANIRRIVLQRFPYHIYYRHLKTNNLRILAIAHNHRKPDVRNDR